MSIPPRFINLIVPFCATVVLAAFYPVQSSAKDTKSSKSTAQTSKATSLIATVITDGALVLSAPDPDASPVAQLPAGKKIRISKGTTGGEMKFHKAAVGNKVGYIAAIDIRIGDAIGPDEGQDATAKSGAKKPSAVAAAKARKEAAKKRMSGNREPMYFARFVGLVAGLSEFKEDIAGVDSSASLPFYGLKVTGPDVVFGGPVVDFNLLLHYGAPSYYDRLSAIKPSGFILITDAIFLLPFASGQNGMGFLGIGPMLMLSQFNVVSAGAKKDLTEINFGADAVLGAAFRAGKAAFRLEAKYFLEKQSYKGLFAAVQAQF